LGTFILVAVIGGGFYLGNFQISPSINTQPSFVNNFEECAEAGNPILESYPAQCNDSEGNHFVEDIGNELEKIDIIRSNKPRPGETISSQFIVKGEARGTWFFEASFPVQLIDENGKVIAETFVEAQSDWMTEEFVAFESILVFKTPNTEKGTLVLKKANPSDFPEHDDELRIPVQFDLKEQTEIVTIHLVSAKSIENEKECDETMSYARNVPKTTTMLQGALEALIMGPTEREKEKGYTTALPDGVTIESLNIEKGIASVVFNMGLTNKENKCVTSAIRAQIANTLKEFSIVEDVEILISKK